MLKTSLASHALPVKSTHFLPATAEEQCYISNDSVTSRYIESVCDMNEFEEEIRQIRQFNTGFLCRNQMFKEFRFKVLMNLQRQDLEYEEFTAFLGNGICLMFVFDASRESNQQRVVYMHSLDTYEVHSANCVNCVKSASKPTKKRRMQA